MADWTGYCRSNYFAVKDKAAYIAWLAKFEAHLIEKDDLVGFYSEAEFGGVPDRYDDETDESVSLLDEIGDHVAPGSVCVVQECGAERLRYITGRAWAISGPDADQMIRLDLDEIYARAEAAFKVKPTEAVY